MARSTPSASGEEGPVRATGSGSDGLPLLLDQRQWAYVCRRYELTPREQQIAQLACRGLRNGHIARYLDVQPGTVKTHMRNIFRKVKVKGKINMLLRFVADSREWTGDKDGAAMAREAD